MKPISKRLLTVILALMVLSFFTGEVQATDYDDSNDSLIVSIESADYLDLDGDQMEDDIITVFTLEVPDGDWEFHRTLIYCKLVLPSGYYFSCVILVYGTYNRFTLTLGWYNTAIEAGWYSFALCAYGIGYNPPEPGFDSIIFDPPTAGEPGSPVIEIIAISDIS